MNRETQKNQSVYLYRTLAVVITAVSMLPVSCNYILQGGRIGEWIAAVEGIAAGTAQTTVRTDFWLIVPGLLRRVSGNIVLTYRVWMLLLQTGTAIFAGMLFLRVFVQKEDRLPALFGFLLYMTSPYRIYISYDSAELFQVIVYMLLPLYGWAFWGMLRGRRSIFEALAGALALAGIGYAEPVVFLALAGVSLVVGMVVKKLPLLLMTVAGSACFLPGILRLCRYLFAESFFGEAPRAELIMDKGYRFGEFFTVYAWRDGHPGMGMGLLICLLAGVWLWLVDREEKKEQGRTEIWWVTSVAIFFSVLALRYFPWDIIQRLGDWSLRLVTLTGTPALFWGLAYSLLCITGAYGIGRIRKRVQEPLATALPLLVLLFCIGCCIYQCNTLTFERMPLPLS